MGEFDEYASDEFDSYASPPEKKSFVREAASRAADVWRNASVPSSMADVKERFGRLGEGIAHPFAEAGREIADEVTHPKRTLQGAPLAEALGYSTPEAVERRKAANREVVRGIQGNIPLAGLAHERLTGFPEQSATDAAKAPHAGGAGTALGMVGLAAAPKVAPLVGRGLGKAANAAQDLTAAGSEAVASGVEGSLARSAARRAVNPQPVRAALKELSDDVQQHYVRHTLPAMMAGSVFGHKAAGLVAALSVAKPAVKTAIIAADEALAALARRGSGAAAKAAEAVNPQIAVLRDALKTASPEQAEAINASIFGIQRKAESLKSQKPAPAGSTPKPRVEEPNVDFDIEEQPVARAAPPARPDTALAVRRPPAPEVQAEYVAPGEAATPRPAPATDVEATRQRALGAIPAEPAPAAAKASGQRVSGTVGAPWEPSAADAKFAQPLGMTVDEYRAMMTRSERRLGRTPKYDDAVQRLAKAAKATTDPEVFVKEATAAGLPEADARAVFKAAHPAKRRGRAKPKAAPEAEAAE